MPWPRRIDNEIVASGYSRSWGKTVRDMAQFLNDMQTASIPKSQKHTAAQLRKRLEGYIEHCKQRRERDE